MTRSSMLVLAGAVLGLVVVCPARADEPQPLERAKLERRVADLERKLEALLKEVKTLRQELAQAVPPTEIKVFPLKHSAALDVATVLQEVYKGKDGPSFRIVADPRTNSVIVRVSPEQLRALEALIVAIDGAKLEDQPRSKKNVGKVDPELVKQAIEALPGPKKDGRNKQSQAEITLQMQDRLAWTERMLHKGYASESQVQAARARLQEAAAKARGELGAKKQPKPEVQKLRTKNQE